jgi:bis(5'-nucleosidyl)-tetraphosphatase
MPGKSKWRKGVFAVCYSIEGKAPEYLLLKRKLHWKGWEFPKGKIEKGEKKIEAAGRELREETGQRILNIRKFNFSGKYRYQKPLPDRPGKIGQTFTLFAAEAGKGKVTLDKKEHSGYKWLDFKDAMKKLKWPNQRKSLRIVNEWLSRGKK